jgi:MoaA/NifB/PqqE/SkfB family radical SAM enzyme
MKFLNELLRSPIFLVRGIRYHFDGLFVTPKPRMIQFPVCDRCNSRCIMCNRWQKDAKGEIGIDKIREVFSSNLFSNVEDVNLHGGEPTLRRDLAEICSIIQDACPDLRRMWISTNGFGRGRIEKRALEILDVLRFGKMEALEINVSLDGLEETHDRIRGIQGGFKQAMETIDMLQQLSESHPIKLSLGTVIQPLNLHELKALEELAENLGIPIFFQPLMFDKFFNIGGDPQLTFSEEQMETFKKTIATKLANGSSTTHFYWHDLLCMMNGAKRKSPCAFDRYVFSLYPTGEVLPCSREEWIVFGNVHEASADEIWFGPKAKTVRRRMKREVCPRCSFYCGVEYALQKEFFTYLQFYLKKKITEHR